MSKDHTSEENVVAFEPDRDPAPVRVVSAKRHCLHRRTAVCRNDRTLTCRDCGAAVDPVECLARLAESYERKEAAERNYAAISEHIGELMRAGGFTLKASAGRITIGYVVGGKRRSRSAPIGPGAVGVATALCSAIEVAAQSLRWGAR